ncbi:flagellar biosynthetic protein FliR [Silvanigrella paludirubra]|uniref:Flagellar biosynthetic protein FliR n=1 Tax=Silvanigrella paludirubra TaxID=2499159 RepID=A0A6N6VPM8_9BACT|nr:flagellar biosynthetic protein FliR [Silvanigrella paludirubra]KAB8036223.1 flagellar biosynthetic protein FliR [Silvanigrella paludirubra]
MDILSVIQLDPKTWPLAVMAFLRITTMFFFLPIFGEQAVPARLRIVLGLAFTFFVYPIVSERIFQSEMLLQWSGLTLILASLREVFFGFAVGYSAKLVIAAVSIAAHTVGINMGFQVASMFSPGASEHESSFAVMKNWFAIILILTLNIHHVFIEGLYKSFLIVPIGPTANASALAKVALNIAHEAFVLGLRLAAPLMSVQILINISLGLLNRALPSLNVFIISFPISFIIAMVVLFLTITSYLSVLGNYGMQKEVAWFESMRRVFVPTNSP